MEEGKGFEPSERLYNVQRFSKPPPSATRPPLRRDATRRLPDSSYRLSRGGGQIEPVHRGRKQGKICLFEKKKQKTSPSSGPRKSNRHSARTNRNRVFCYFFGKIYPKCFLYRLIHQPRIPLPPHPLHHLARQKTPNSFSFPRPILRQLIRIALQSPRPPPRQSPPYPSPGASPRAFNNGRRATRQSPPSPQTPPWRCGH